MSIANAAKNITDEGLVQSNEGLLKTLGDYINSFRPNLSKKDILLDIQCSSEQISASTIVTLERLKVINNKLSSASSIDVMYGLKNKNGNYLDEMLKCANNIDSNIELLITEVEKSFPDAVVKNAMDYRQVNILKYIEAINYFTTYVAKLNQVLALESIIALSKVNDLSRDSIINKIQTVDLSNQILKLDLGIYLRTCREYVNDVNNKTSFINAYNILILDFNTFLKKIKDLRGHVYNESDFGSVKTPTNRLIDPFSVGFVNVMWNPFYHIGIAYTSWRAKRNEQAKAELQTVNLTIALLQERQTATDDKEAKAKLLTQIEFWMNESNRLQSQITDYEEA